jgi:hypothetical protein
MHYNILVFTCPYICFGTPCAILRGVVEISQFSVHKTPQDGKKHSKSYVKLRFRLPELIFIYIHNRNLFIYIITAHDQIRSHN